MANNWSRQEESLLTKEYTRGSSTKTISRLLEEMGNKRTITAVEHKVDRLGLLRKHEALIDGKRVGHLDIETNGFNADFHTMLCWYIKENNENKFFHDNITQEDRNLENKLQIDKRITQSLVDTLNDFDVIVTYYGEGFDLPFVRSRAIFHNIDFPHYGNILSIDAWKIARVKLKLHSNRLDSVADFFGVNSKTKLDFRDWVPAVFGDEKALSRILEHNKQDVITLDHVYNKLAPFTAGTRRSI